MAWVKAVSNNGDDVFDESGDDITLLSKEWTSNMKKRVRDGFVDGADAGEDACLQDGFNLGYREGAAQTAAVGRLKGIVSAICCWCQIRHPESPVPASVTDLLKRITQHEDTIVAGIKYALEHPPPSVSDVSESMEDLEVEQGESNCGGGGCKEGGCKETNCCGGGGGGCKEGGCNETNCCGGGGGCKEGGCNETNCCGGGGGGCKEGGCNETNCCGGGGGGCKEGGCKETNCCGGGGGCKETNCCGGGGGGCKEGGCKETNCCGGGGGCKEGGCKETNCGGGGEKMDVDASPQQRKPCSASTDCSSSSSGGLNHLLSLCVDVVSELGLPQELTGHIQELWEM